MYFITGNAKKFGEVKLILPEVEQLDIDLEEIQSTDPREIVAVKLEKARRHHNGEFIVEDTGLYLKCLNGLPGPFIKWFLEEIGTAGVFEMANKLGNLEAEAKTVIGYLDKNNETHYFEGVIPGKLVAPTGENLFGWDPIFQPDGHEKTFGEMTREEKNEISMRRMATNKLRDYLGRIEN